MEIDFFFKVSHYVQSTKFRVDSAGEREGGVGEGVHDSEQAARPVYLRQGVSHHPARLLTPSAC
jgi:hypothetical protein